MSSPRALLLSVFALGAFGAGTFTQSAIPLRAVSAPVGTDSGLLATITNIRPLSDGRVLVNDQGHRRLLLFDSTLAHVTVVMDSAQDSRDKYGSQALNLFPYVGDSSALLDVNARVFVIVSPNGTVAHSMAMPRQSDLLALAVVLDPAGFDAKGRLILRVFRSKPAGPATPAVASQDSAPRKIVLGRDTSAIIRIDPDTKAVDTMGFLDSGRRKTPYTWTGTRYSAERGARNPFPDPDDYALFSDGSIAIVRGHDYHVDWVSPTLTTASSGKLPFDWKRIPDEVKQQKSDSLKALAKAGGSQLPPMPPSARGGAGPVLPPSGPVWFEPSEMTDYYPAVRVWTTRADLDGNVWVLPTTSVLAGKGLVYDVVNRRGELFQRVRLPEGRNLIAVGRDGVVYMSYTPKGGLIRLERARVLP